MDILYIVVHELEHHYILCSKLNIIKFTFGENTKKERKYWMITEDIVSTILEKTQNQMGGIDQIALRRILEDTMSAYTVQAKDGVGEASDLPDKIAKYLSCRKLDGLSELTIKNYKYNLDRFAEFVQKRVTTITAQDIREFLSHLVETRNITNSTLETQKSILKAFFGWLETEEYITNSPTKKIRPTKCAKPIKKSLTLTLPMPKGRGFLLRRALLSESYALSVGVASRVSHGTNLFLGY